MDKTEARVVLAEQLAIYRGRSYADLVSLVGTNSVVEARGQSGAEYQIEIEVLWDSKRDKLNVLVTGAIDDGRFFSALSPVCDSFIVAPDGTFVGE
jgi:hypothetical protein